MKKFEINSLILYKYGWTEYKFLHRGLIFPNLSSYNVSDDHNIKYIIEVDDSVFYIQQIAKNQYKFISIDKNRQRTKDIVFESNIELMKLVIEHSACTEDYKRHFKINKILNK